MFLSVKLKTQNHLKKESFEWFWGRRNSCRICIYGWCSWGALPPNFCLSRNITLKLFRQWNTAFKSVAWRRFWSWTLAISSLFSSDLDKFKLETQIKTLKNVVDEKQVGIKEAIKIISSLNAFRKLLVFEAFRFVKLILLIPTTNTVSEKSCSTLCRVGTYLRLSMTQAPVTAYLIVTTYKKQVDKRKLVEVASQFCFKNERHFSIKE